MTRVPKDFAKAARQARREGWTVYRQRSGHYRWVPPSGEIIITASTANGGHRGTSNARALLRKAGLDA